jgi:hypothetical protein
MSRNRYLKWIQSYSFSAILQHGLSVKVHHFPRMLWVKLNTKISVLHNLLCHQLMWANISCKMSINWHPYQISEESCCTVQSVSIILYMWPTRWNILPALFMRRVWAISSHRRWKWIVAFCNFVVSRSFDSRLCLISQCVALASPAWSYIDVPWLFLHKCVLRCSLKWEFNEMWCSSAVAYSRNYELLHQRNGSCCHCSLYFTCHWRNRYVS